MKAEQLLLTILHAKQAEVGGELALLGAIDKNGPKYGGFGKQGATTWERPIITLLQEKNAGASWNIIATTTPPTEMEIGFAWKFGVERIIYNLNGALQNIKVTSDGSTFVPQLLVPADPDIKVRTAGADPALPAPFNNNTAQAWHRALNAGGALSVAGERAKTAIPGVLYTKAVDVPANLSIGLDAMPGVGLAKKEFADMVFMHVTYALVAMGWRDTDKDEGGGFNIGAILVDKTQKIIAWGLNLVSANKSFHAETLMFQAYLKRSGEANLPDGCTMYTTLESCHMCAGFAATIGSGLRVVYGQKDNQIVNSALERKVNGTSQVLTSVAFQATGTPPVNVTVTPGPAGVVIAKLRNDYQAIYLFTGVTKFLFHDIGKYFYTVEKAMPKQMTTRIDELKKPTPSFAPAKMTSLPMLDPSKTFAPKAPLGHLDLAFPSKPIADADRDAMNKRLFGAELELANYALKFLTTLKDAGILKN